MPFNTPSYILATPITKRLDWTGACLKVGNELYGIIDTANNPMTLGTKLTNTLNIRTNLSIVKLEHDTIKVICTGKELFDALYQSSNEGSKFEIPLLAIITEILKDNNIKNSTDFLQKVNAHIFNSIGAKVFTKLGRTQLSRKKEFKNMSTSFKITLCKNIGRNIGKDFYEFIMKKEDFLVSIHSMIGQYVVKFIEEHLEEIKQHDQDGGLENKVAKYCYNNAIHFIEKDIRLRTHNYILIMLLLGKDFTAQSDSTTAPQEAVSYDDIALQAHIKVAKIILKEQQVNSAIGLLKYLLANVNSNISYLLSKVIGARAERKIYNYTHQERLKLCDMLGRNIYQEIYDVIITNDEFIEELYLLFHPFSLEFIETNFNAIIQSDNLEAIRKATLLYCKKKNIVFTKNNIRYRQAEYLVAQLLYGEIYRKGEGESLINGTNGNIISRSDFIDGANNLVKSKGD